MTYTQAISNPGEEYQAKAKEAVFPLVVQLKRYHEFSHDIGILQFITK
jgi:CYRIA/CYRIB Rac1 binding domain